MAQQSFHCQFKSTYQLITDAFISRSALCVRSDLTGVKVVYPEHLDTSTFGVQVSGVKFSLLIDDVVQFNVSLIRRHRYTEKSSEYSYTMPEPDAAHWCQRSTDFNKKQSISLNSASWPDLANQLKIDIMILEPKS